MKAACMWTFILEWVVVLNLPLGPWLGSAWHQTMRDGLASYMASHDWTCALFQSLYERIAFEFNDASPAVLGSEQHMKKIFDDVGSAKVFRTKGTRVKLSRWISVWDAWAEFAPYRSAYLLILSYVCLRQGVVKHRDELPMFSSSASLASASAPDGHVVCPSRGVGALAQPAASGQEQRKEVRHSNDEVTKMRNKAKNTLHLALLILGDSRKVRIMTGMSLMMVPVRERCGQMITQLKTRRGAVEWWIGAQHPSHVAAELSGIVCALTSPDAAMQCRFLPSESFLKQPPVDAVAEDIACAQALRRAQLGLLAQRLMGHLACAASLPGKFAGLLNKDKAAQQECLKELGKWFDL